MTGRRWLVWEDDNPAHTEPLTAAEAAAQFLHLANDDPDAQYDIRQCTDDELEWAGMTGSPALEVHDICDGAGNLALPINGAKLWNPNMPDLGWHCPHEDDEDDE
jgi:hypothetical protein